MSQDRERFRAQGDFAPIEQQAAAAKVEHVAAKLLSLGIHAVGS
jgi:hypothetical protein